jgi:hypothetical protein
MQEEKIMSDPIGNMPRDHQPIADLDQRIAAIRENIRELIEQAAADSGAADDELASERIAQQEQLLDVLVKQREEISPQAGGVVD